MCAVHHGLQATEKVLSVHTSSDLTGKGREKGNARSKREAAVHKSHNDSADRDKMWNNEKKKY